MAKTLITKTSFNLLKCGLLAISVTGLGLMAGCGDDSGSSSSGPAKIAAKISGKVSNKNGIIEEGKLDVRDKSGNVVTTTHFTNGQYTVTVPASTAYPIVIAAHPPVDALLSDPVKAVVTSPIADVMDVTAVTTDIVDGAIALGGITEENITKASGVAINMRQKEGVSAGAGGSGGGPGNSGGGAGAGGHGGHNMDAMRKSATENEPEKK
jgi:hypothetical protein